MLVAGARPVGDDDAVPRSPAPKRAHRAPQRVGVVEQRRPALEQELARLGQLDVVRRAPQQLDAELVLEQAHLAAQRRLRDVQALGRAREVALARATATK